MGLRSGSGQMTFNVSFQPPFEDTQIPHSSLGYPSPALETILPKSHMLPYYGEAA